MLIDYGLQRDEYALTNDDFISSAYQASYCNSFLDEIQNKFKVFKENTEKPEMEKYEIEINCLKDMDEIKFNNFIEDLKKLKNCEGTLPEKYCDYLIKQKLDSNSILNKNLEQYLPIFKRAFEDKARSILKSYGIDNYIVQITNELEEDTLGVQGFKYIRFAEEQLKNLNDNNINAIITMFHETRHALQNKHMEYDNQFSANEYKMLKEQIIRIYNPKFYNKNYKFMINEIDARIHGRKGAYTYLKEIGFSNKKILDMDGKDFFECYNEKQKLEMENYKLARKKIDSDGEKKLVNNIFWEILQDNQQLIKEYPVLEIEFDESGARRHGISILKDYEEALNESINNPEKLNDNRLKLIPSILEDRSEVYVDTIIEDSEMLLNYYTDNKIVKKYRDIIIKNEILKQINDSSKEKAVYIYEDDKNEEAKENFNRLVQNIYKFAMQNPEEKISNTILETVEEFIPEANKSEAEVNALKVIDKSVKANERQDGINTVKSMTKVKEDEKIQNNEIHKE